MISIHQCCTKWMDRQINQTDRQTSYDGITCPCYYTVYMVCVCVYIQIKSKQNVNQKFGAEPNMRPPGAIGLTGEKFRALKFPSQKVLWPKLKCLSIHKTRSVDIKQINMRAYTFLLLDQSSPISVVKHKCTPKTNASGTIRVD